MPIVTDEQLEAIIKKYPKTLVARAYLLGRKKMSLELAEALKAKAVPA